MQFRLRTLLIVLAVGAMVLAGAWSSVRYALHRPNSIFQVEVRTGTPFEYEKPALRAYHASELDRNHPRTTEQP